MLEILHRGKKAKTLVVFVHGLQGGEDTWRNEETGFYLPIALGEDKQLKDSFSIGLFTYYSRIFAKPPIFGQGKNLISNLFGKASKKVKFVLDINSVSDLLLTYLQTHSSDYESIVLICHSMGGLIAKALTVKHRNSEVFSKVELIISLAVPHNGSNLALWGKALLKNIQIDGLAPLNDIITKLTQEWIDGKDTNPNIVYLQGKYDTVVSETSAIAFDANPKDIRYCDDDHSSIAKPTSQTSLVYLTIKGLLLDLSKRQVFEEELGKDSSAIDVDDELYVTKLFIANVHDTLVKNAKQRFFDAERARKAARRAGIADKTLNDLYEKIGQIYINEFGRVLSGELNSGNALLTAVYGKIQAEDLLTLKSLERLNFTHKTGMIHQLANNIEKDIWWAKDQGIHTVDEFRKRKGTMI